MTVSREDAVVVQATQAGKSFMQALHHHEHKLHALVKHGCTMVGNVEVAALSGEVKAAVESETRRDAWKNTLEEDTRKTQEALKQIHQYWEKVVTLTIPEDLYDGLCQLRDWSQELTEQKVWVIGALRGELRVLDATYTEEMLQHAHQRSELLRRITEHVTELHQAYRHSLREVQGVEDKERAELVEYYGRVWDEAVTELNQKLQDLLHDRLNNRTSRMEQIIELKLHGAAPHTAIKDKLDSDIEKVLVEVMRMKAAQQVEESQLRYSQQVLQQQYRETTAMVSEARRTLNAITPTLNNYRRKAEAAKERRVAQEQAKLREAGRMRELNQQYRKRLANNSAFFSQQTQGLSQMHYQKLHELVMEVVETERAIQHSVLAREWVEPDLTTLSDLAPAPNPRQTHALAAATKILQPSQDGSVDGFEGSLSVDEQFLTSLAEEAVFLINTDTSHLTQHGPLLILEHIFWEIGIHTEADVLRLLRVARRYISQRPPGSRGRGREEEEREEEEEEAIGGRWRESDRLFTPADTLNVLITFCNARKSGEEGSVGAADVDEEGPLYAQEGEEAARWSSFLNNFCKRIRVWTATRDALTQYRDVLIGRLEEMRKVDRLRRENAELRFLLQGVVNDL
ncbi:dynein regulatory complex protein 1-like isoform X2 [Homarus americanus]|nr:dynein regulatory complex protein 1-like isoform X2 [Homarus americanus]